MTEGYFLLNKNNNGGIDVNNYPLAISFLRKIPVTGLYVKN